MCIDLAIADRLLAMNEWPDDAYAVIRAGSRHRMTDESGAVVTCWRFTCTTDEAMIIRLELSAAAFAVHKSNPTLSKELLKTERVVARAMRGSEG